MDCSYGGVAPFMRNMHPILIQKYNVEYFTIPKSWNSKFIPGRLKLMAYLIKKHKDLKSCDFILSHVPEGSYIASYTGNPYCHIFHGNDNPMTQSRYRIGKYFRWLFEIFFNRIEKTCPLKYTVGPVCGDRKKLFNPICHNTSEKPYESRKGFIFAGRLELIKNIDHIIRIYSKLPVQIRDVHHLYIAGTGTQEHKLKDLVKEMSLTKFVHFLGNVQNKEIVEVDSTKRIFLMASTQEGLPTAIAEALSVGVPVITTNPGDIGLVIKNNVNGFLFPLDFNDDDYVKAIMSILNEYDRFSKAAKESSVVFDSKKITNDVIKDIECILNNSGNETA